LQATGAIKAGTPGRARYKLQHHRAGNAGVFRRTCGNGRLRFLLQAGHGCGVHPAFPAPSVWWGAYMIATRARCAAGTRSHALMKPCHKLDRKSRSADSHHQSSAAQLQKRCALPFTYRHRRSLLPQLGVSAGGGCRVMACAFARPNGI